jgi:hypothetical protein
VFLGTDRGDGLDADRHQGRACSRDGLELLEADADLLPVKDGAGQLRRLLQSESAIPQGLCQPDLVEARPPPLDGDLNAA